MEADDRNIDYSSKSPDLQSIPPSYAVKMNGKVRSSLVEKLINYGCKVSDIQKNILDMKGNIAEISA